MIFGIYAIKDQVTGLFGQPFLEQNKGAAVRRFEYVCSKAEMIAADSQLFFLGTFNQETGEIVYKQQFLQSYVERED